MSPEEKFQKYRNAVHWLFDCAKLLKMFPEDDVWRGEGQGEMHTIATRTYKEAIDNVIKLRKDLDVR